MLITGNTHKMLEQTMIQDVNIIMVIAHGIVSVP